MGDTKKRVLVWGLTNRRAGTETAISNITRTLAGKVAFDFLVMEEVPTFKDLITHSNRIFVIPDKRRNTLGYFRDLKRHFKQHAHEYDAVWCNLNILNNIDVLTQGKKFGIPRRILHAHSLSKDGNLHQRILCAINSHIYEDLLTDRWACSHEAGEFFFPGYEFRVIPNAINFTSFEFDPTARVRIREQLGCGDARLIGAVGRLVPPKNHHMLIDALAQMVEAGKDVQLAIVGDGELKEQLIHHAAAAGVSSKVHFCGAQNDTQPWLSAFDVFAMPSMFEGLGLALLEAQANGLPCVVSDTIPTESFVSNGIRTCAPLNVSGWVDALMQGSRDDVALIPEKAQHFDLTQQAALLESLF